MSCDVLLGVDVASRELTPILVAALCFWVESELFDILSGKEFEMNSFSYQVTPGSHDFVRVNDCQPEEERDSLILSLSNKLDQIINNALEHLKSEEDVEEALDSLLAAVFPVQAEPVR